MIKIKVCGLTDLTPMDDLMNVTPDYIGFIYYPPSKRWIADSQIAEKSYGNAKKVGVFVNEQIDKVAAISVKNGFDIIQLHGDESPQYCRELKNQGFNVMKVFSIDSTKWYE